MADLDMRDSVTKVPRPIESVDGRVPTATIVADPNDPTRTGEFDNLFYAPLVVDVAHHEIHEGDSFSIVATDAVAASGKLVQMYIKTPVVASPQKRIHLIVSHQGSGLHSFSITEGIDTIAGGAAYVPVNRRRDSIKVTAGQAARVGGDNLTGGLLTYANGTIIWAEVAGAGKGQASTNRGTDEWILAPNTEYIFELSSGATSTSIGISTTWYEHTDSL
jgi:hypothetical protein